MKTMRAAVAACAVLAAITGSDRSQAACGDFVNAVQYAGRNAWAKKCGYLDSGTETILNQNSSYLEFNGCYKSRTTGAFCSPAIPVDVNASCISGLVIQDFCPYYDCYTPSQRIVADGTLLGIEDAARLESRVVTTLAAEVDGDVTLAEQPIVDFTKTDFDGEVLVITGSGGERLEVTATHPVVKMDGSIVNAEAIRPGDELLNSEGKAVRVQAVEAVPYHGPVWNVVTDADDAFGNIIVVEGMLAGTMYFPTERADDLFRLSIRDGVDVDKLLRE